MTVTATPATTNPLAVLFHGRTLTVEFVAPDGVGSPLEGVRTGLQAAVAAGLAADPTAAKLKKLTAGLTAIKANLVDAKAEAAAAQTELTAATADGDIDAMLRAKARIAAGEARAAAAAEAADMILTPLAAAQRAVEQVAERAAFAAHREQLDAAAATTERLRAKVENAVAGHLLELSKAAGAMNVLANAPSIFDIGDLRVHAATAAVTALARDAAK
jgi:hypothetical protein